MATEVASPRQTTASAPGSSCADDGGSSDSGASLDVRVVFAGQTHVFHLAGDAVLDDLTIACEDQWDGAATDGTAAYDWSSHKYIGPPPVGLLKGGEDGERPLAPLLGSAGAGAGAGTRTPPATMTTLRLIAPRLSAVQALRAASASVRQRAARRQEQRRHAVRAQTTMSGTGFSSSSALGSSSPYSFQALQPLEHLPHADRSLAFLQRLRDDVGVRAAMRTHRLAVGLLTEMDPRQHTTASHEGTTRTLGLNRNQGQVVELRLRTDAGDGYRDYRTVRRTLCHELAHNVHGPHDARFWALCRQLERAVEHADYHGSGRTLAGDDHVDRLAAYQTPIRNDGDDDNGNDEDDEHTDAGGWTGGSFVLGSGGDAAATATAATNNNNNNTPSISRRDLAARAAEDRLRRLAEQKRNHGDGTGDGNGNGNGNGNGSSGTSSNR